MWFVKKHTYIPKHNHSSEEELEQRVMNADDDKVMQVLSEMQKSAKAHQSTDRGLIDTDCHDINTLASVASNCSTTSSSDCSVVDAFQEADDCDLMEYYGGVVKIVSDTDMQPPFRVKTVQGYFQCGDGASEDADEVLRMASELDASASVPETKCTTPTPTSTSSAMQIFDDETVVDGDACTDAFYDALFGACTPGDKQVDESIGDELECTPEQLRAMAEEILGNPLEEAFACASPIAVHEVSDKKVSPVKAGTKRKRRGGPVNPGHEKIRKETYDMRMHPSKPVQRKGVISMQATLADQEPHMAIVGVNCYASSRNNASPSPCCIDFDVIGNARTLVVGTRGLKTPVRIDVSVRPLVETSPEQVGLSFTRSKFISIFDFDLSTIHYPVNSGRISQMDQDQLTTRFGESQYDTRSQFVLCVIRHSQQETTKWKERVAELEALGKGCFITNRSPKGTKRDTGHTHRVTIHMTVLDAHGNDDGTPELVFERSFKTAGHKYESQQIGLKDKSREPYAILQNLAITSH